MKKVTNRDIEIVVCAVKSGFAIDERYMPAVEEAVRRGYLTPFTYWEVTDAGEELTA